MTPPPEPLQSRLLSALAFCLGMALIVVSIATGIEVISRNFLGFSLEGVDEISGYTLAGVSAWGFAYALITRSHIRIDSLIQFAGLRLRAWLDVVAYGALLVMAVVMTMHSWHVFEFSLEHMSRSQTPLRVPLWIPQGIWLSGMAAFTTTAASVFVRACWMLSKRHYADVTATLSASELEIEMEILSDQNTRRKNGVQP